MTDERITAPNKYSKCCGAGVYDMGGNYICKSCRDWTEAVDGEE